MPNNFLYKTSTVYYLLTHSMVQGPSWAADWLAASQEIPRISRNPKVHYRTHKRPPPVPILGQPDQVHMPTSHLLEIHPNIIHQVGYKHKTWRHPDNEDFLSPRCQWRESTKFVQKVSGLTTVHEVDKAYGVLTQIVLNIVPFRSYTLRPTFLPPLETFFELFFRVIW